MSSEHAFGDWLRRRRRALDLTQEELARQVGFSVVTLRKLEAETRRPSKQTAERLADVLGVLPAERSAFLRFARGDPFAAPATAQQAGIVAAPGIPSGTLTLLFTDIEGSTGLLQQAGSGYAILLSEMRMILRAAFEHSGGREVDTQGDAFFVAFTRASDAVQAAVEGQRMLVGHDWPPGIVLKVRMGLHTGEPDLGPVGYTGLAVHQAARIGAAAHGGQVLLSQTTRDLLLDSDLPTGVSLRDLGEHRLKDLRRLLRLYQLVIAGLPADFPLLKSLDALRHNLPVQLTSFIGRQRDVATAKRLLGESRLLTLTGVGGTGKTRLALQVAADVLEAHADGVWLVELAPLAEPDLLTSVVATTLGLRIDASRTVREALLDFLRLKSLLLILDNCEHLIEACAELASAILQACPRVRILATSREALDMAGEALHPVPSLQLPYGSDLAAVTASEAGRLFVERARAVAQHFQISALNAAAIGQICQQLDGVPLALELAAARVNLLAPEQIVERLNDRFRLLASGRRTAPARQQTLQATMEWSYQLLSAPERVLFQRLSVFAGGFTLDAAEHVCSGDGLGGEAVLDRLSGLVSKSLVVASSSQGQPPRFSLPETVRQYARAKLGESGTADAFLRRHAEFFFELVQGGLGVSNSPAPPAWYDQLDPECDNLRVALAWSLAAADGAQMALVLTEAMPFAVPWNEARSWLEKALTHPDGLTYPGARARVLRSLGSMASQLGDFAIAAALLTESLSIFQALDDSLSSAHLLRRLGWLAREQGDVTAARSYLNDSLSMFRSLGDRLGIAGVQVTLGEVAVADEDAAGAEEALEASLSTFRQQGDKHSVAWALNHLGHVSQLRGNLEHAVRLHHESLLIVQPSGADVEHPVVAWAHESLGEIALACDDGPSAEGHFITSLGLARNQGYRPVTAWCLAGLAGAAVLAEAPDRAARIWGAAEALRKSIGARPAPAARSTRERLIATAREKMGDEAFAAEWTEGARLTLDQVLVLVSGAG